MRRPRSWWRDLSPRISRYMWVIGFLTGQQARFDAPNMASVASTNKLLPCLSDRTANWHKLWPIFCLFSFVLAVITVAVHGRRRTGAGSVLAADSFSFFKQKKRIFFIKIGEILLLKEVNSSQVRLKFRAQRLVPEPEAMRRFLGVITCLLFLIYIYISFLSLLFLLICALSLYRSITIINL